MSSKHYFPETAANQLVSRALRAHVRANPHLSLIESERAVYNNCHQPSKVAVISGGGSGHEPAWAGYVGDGLLAGAACGDIFASPSMKQVLAAVEACPSTEGTILMITNYTGDKLHFGLAAERAMASGLAEKVVVLPATDDVSIPRSRVQVGRRGLAGHVITLKIVGAAAEGGLKFDECVKIGRAVNDSLVTIGSALDHCHVPGRQGHESVGSDVCVVGAGIHNEPGAEKITPFPSVESLIRHLLSLLCDPTDKERAFVQFDGRHDDIILLLNNYGGLSNLELGALNDEVLRQLEVNWNIRPRKIFCGAFETSLNAPGFSVSLCNLTQAGKNTGLPASELLRFLEAPTTAPAWPNIPGVVAARGLQDSTPLNQANISPGINGSKSKREAGEQGDIRIDPKVLDSMIREGCKAAIAAEPKLTEWDMVMGDGDCGEAVKGVCEAILGVLDNTSIASEGSVLQTLFAIMDAVDDMGGTLGAIFGILLSAFTRELQHQRRCGPEERDGRCPEVYAAALHMALESLKTYTSAREGDRTVMDVLIPFADAFSASNNFSSAVKVAGEKAEQTRKLKPKLGRATYVSEHQEQQLPDPGAWALFEMIRGMQSGLLLCT